MYRVCPWCGTGILLAGDKSLIKWHVVMCLGFFDANRARLRLLKYRWLKKVRNAGNKKCNFKGEGS